MNANCTICSEIFDTKYSIFATPCGHVFHANCLFRWINKSKTCPECRTSITCKSVKKLYFNVNAYAPSAATVDTEAAHLKKMLEDKESELSECNKLKQELHLRVIKAEAEAAVLKKTTEALQLEVTELRAKSEAMANVPYQVGNLEPNNSSLNSPLSEMQGMYGSQNDFRDILVNLRQGEDVANQLMMHCANVNLEVIKVVELKNSYQELAAHQKTVIEYGKIKLKQAYKEIEAVKHKLHLLKKRYMENCAKFELFKKQYCNNSVTKRRSKLVRKTT